MAAVGSNSRESISKNATLAAREAAKRFPDHREVIKQFIQNFAELPTPGSQPDPKFGNLKYKAMLRNAVNRHLDTILIDLNDVEDYCKQQLEAPGDDAESQHSKMQQSTVISMMLDDIENNAVRYGRFFYDACDQLKPGQDEGKSENANDTFEKIMAWRTKRAEAMGGSILESIPVQMRNPFSVRFKPRKTVEVFNFRDVKSSHCGALVSFECIVVRTGEVKPRMEVATYRCEECESEIFQVVESDMYTPPKDCPSQRCKERKQAGKLRPFPRTSKFGKNQELRVQELSHQVPTGGVPRGINVVCSADLCRQCAPGDSITLTGVYTPSTLPYYIQRNKGTSQEMYIEAHHILKHKKGYNSSDNEQMATQKRVEEAMKKGSLYENASRSIAPEIFGMEDVKKALLLALVGGFTKKMGDGMKIRGEVHTLFMGDPGVAKSQLMKQACKIAPRSVYTTGKGTSGVGLTASVIRDNVTGEVSLEGGALVLADTGICCIDEFDKMDENDRTAIHEVMEQQSISIAKAGITTTLNTRTTIIAAANPQFGRYDPFKSPVENIDLPPALLSRFDLLFLLLDTVDPDKDKQLAMHVGKVHKNYDPNSERMRAEDAQHTSIADVLNLGFESYDSNFLRSYIRGAKEYEPFVENSLQKDIVEAYVQMREDEKKGDMDSRKSYTTPRTLLAILRLSQAHARCRYSKKVERQDFDEALRLMAASKSSVELSAPSKRGTAPLDLVYEVIQNLAGRDASPEGWVEMAHVVSMCGHKALNSEQVHDAIEQWEGLSVLTMDPTKKLVRFVVPT